MTERYSISQTNCVTARAAKPHDVPGGEGSPDESDRASVFGKAGRKAEQTGNAILGKSIPPVTGDESNMSEAEFETTGPAIGPRKNPNRIFSKHRPGWNDGENNSTTDKTTGEA